MAVYLNPCPICSEEATLSKSQTEHSAHKTQDAYFCECPACGKSTDEFLSEQEAASVWNKSRAEDLKDVDERIVRSAVLKPVKTWLSTVSRLFMIPLGPLVIFALLLSFDFKLSWMVNLLLGIAAAFWLGIFIAAYVKYAGPRLRLIRHLPEKSRIGNLLAIAAGYITVLGIQAALYVYMLIPMITVGQLAAQTPPN